MSINDIRQLVWQGALNVQITVKPTLLAVDESPKDCAVNLRIPRDIYLTCYLPAIIARVRDSLRVDLDDEEQHIWLEFENVPLYWNYPAGVLYDSMIGLNPSEREDKDAENSLEVWRLELAQGPKLPPRSNTLNGGTAADSKLFDASMETGMLYTQWVLKAGNVFVNARIQPVLGKCCY